MIEKWPVNHCTLDADPFLADGFCVINYDLFDGEAWYVFVGWGWGPLLIVVCSGSGKCCLVLITKCFTRQVSANGEFLVEGPCVINYDFRGEGWYVFWVGGWCPLLIVVCSGFGTCCLLLMIVLMETSTLITCSSLEVSSF